MANPSTVENMLSGIQDGIVQRVLKGAFRYFLTDIRFGRATGSTQSTASQNVTATNLSGFYVSAITPSVANREFSIPHNLGAAPYLCVPVIPLNVLNAGMVRLVVSRIADANNLYFKSPDTNQLFFVYVEG